MDPDGVVRLLSAILADLPRLPGAAACRGHHELFDPSPGGRTVLHGVCHRFGVVWTSPLGRIYHTPPPPITHDPVRTPTPRARVPAVHSPQ